MDGQVFWDKNSNGVQDIGEPNMAGMTVNIKETAGALFVGTAITDANGLWVNNDMTEFANYKLWVNVSDEWYAINGGDSEANAQLVTAGPGTNVGTIALNWRCFRPISRWVYKV